MGRNEDALEVQPVSRILPAERMPTPDRVGGRLPAENALDRAARFEPTEPHAHAAMTDPTYSFRLHPFAREKRYVLRPDAVEWHDRTGVHRIRYAEVAKLASGQVRYRGSSTYYWTCVVFPRQGGIVRLSAAHRAGLRRVEDRSASYMPFIAELQRRIIAANPQVIAAHRRSWLERIRTALGHVGVGAIRMLRRMDLDRIGPLAGRVMRLVGPRLRGHRIARAQLEMAFPDKSADEIKRILAGMWDNLGRVFVEYAYLDRMWDFDPQHPNSGRIVMDEVSAERSRRACADTRPALYFGAHLANWEMGGSAGRSWGRQCAVVYRAPRAGPVADEVSRIRANMGYVLIPAGPDIAFRLKDALKQNLLVGMLIDQHYTNGVDVTFFGRRCKANPMFARFARMFDCPIYGARMIRLADGRMQFELTEPIDPPRDARGRIDVAATTQRVTEVMEAWVREHPEQWMWLHRRWR